MIAAMSGKLLTINWPGAWFPCHLTTKRLINKGALGEVTWVHYCGGNRGPLYHPADRVETAPTLQVDEQSITVVR